MPDEPKRPQGTGATPGSDRPRAASPEADRPEQAAAQGEGGQKSAVSAAGLKTAVEAEGKSDEQGGGAAGPAVCLYFQAHQPYRLIEYDFFSIGEHAYYDNDWLNEEVIHKVSARCYEPACRIFQRAIEETGGKFRFALSMSGVLLDQLAQFRPKTLEAFQELVATGCVELLSETYYHSLASQYSPRELHCQIDRHKEKIHELFGQTPRVFRNTELIYTNWLASEAEYLGFDGILAEGVSWLLAGRIPNHTFRAPNVQHITTLVRNAGLSDDLGFRFGDATWKEHPVTAEKAVRWLIESGGEVANLFLDLETIGERQSAETGIYQFWEALPPAALAEGLRFLTPSEVVDEFPPGDVYDSHAPTSWADQERDLSAWLGNIMQREAAWKIHHLEEHVRQAEDEHLAHMWRKMQTSDHLYYMSTKTGLDGEAHSGFSHHRSPYNAYIYFMNAMADLEIRLRRKHGDPEAVSLSALSPDS